MNWEAFKKKFHPSWHPHIKDFIESEECDQIFKLLKERAQSGIKIAPISHNTFKAFEIPLDDVEVLVLGARPYNGFVDGYPVANGLYLDCSTIEKPSYELTNFYRGIEKDLYAGLNLEYYPNTASLKYLTDQGVMLMTAALTVEEAGDHNNLWFPFTMYVMKIIDKLKIPAILIGEDAIPFANFLSDENVYRLQAPKGTISEWETNNVFLEVNRQLEAKNKNSIMWLNIEPPF